MSRLLKLKEELDINKERYLEILKELVAIDTHDINHGIDGGLEKCGQEYIIALLEKIGAIEITTEQLREDVIQRSIREFQEGNPDHNYNNRYNVYARFAGSGGRSIMFNGHIDTMSPGDESLWTSPPHSPEIRGDRLYGLGVCDMKAGLLASILAVDLIKQAGMNLQGDVIITSVVDEEGGGNGSIAAALAGEKADAAVVCEPTDYELITAHMGFIFFEVSVKGKAVHSGSKWLGVSAIDKAIKIIANLNDLEHYWLMNYKHMLLPSPNLNVGVIEGGTAGSTVAATCVFKTCVHYLPEIMTREQVIEDFNKAVSLCCDGDNWLKDNRPEVTIYQAGKAFEMYTGHKFVKTFCSAFKSSLGREVRLTGSPAGCDARIWKNIAGLPTLQYGPGSIAQCHAVDEYIEINQFFDAILLYAQLILEWCV